MKQLIRLGSVLAVASLCVLAAPVEASLSNNRLAANRLAANRLAANRLASNRLAANTIAANATTDGAFITVSQIELANGALLTR